MFFLDFGSLWVLAYLLVGRLNVIPAVCERIALGFALALGLKSLVIFLLVVLGMTASIWVQLGVSLGALGVAVVFRCRPSVNVISPACPSEKKPLLFVMTFLILGSLFCFSLAYAFFFPITEADGIWYHVRGMVFLHTAGFDSETVVSQFRQYPPFVALLFAYLMSFGVDPVKIIFPFIYLSLLVIFYCRILAGTKNQQIASWFTLILGTTPYFWWHSFLPFLDLTTGFYFSIGALYWFFLIQNIFIEKTEEGPSSACSWAFLSGTLFGLAAWSRLEFLLYNAIPILILIYFLDRNSIFSKAKKNKILLCLAVPIMFFSTLWFLTLAGFDTPLERRVFAVGLAGMGMWGIVLANLKWNFHLNNKRLIGMGALAVIGYLAMMLAGGPQSVSLGKALSITLIRSISVHAFYLCTLFLGTFLFFEKLKKLSEPEKLLGWFLLFYPLVHFLIFSYSEPKWNDLSAYIEVLLVHPGHSINLSDTRGMLAFYPILIFFISGLPMVRRSFSHE
jgi:hypothetical protein